MKSYCKSGSVFVILALSFPIFVAQNARASEWISSSCWTEGEIRTCQRFGIGNIKRLNSCEISHQRKFQEVNGKNIKSKNPKESDFAGAKTDRNRWESINCCKETVDGRSVSRGGDPDMDYEVMEGACRKAGFR